MRVVVSASGGGLVGLGFHAGIVKYLLDEGHEIVEWHGVSAGAGIGALVAQGDAAQAAELGRTIQVGDGHRWLTGPEMVSEWVRHRLQALGTNERTWRFLQKSVKDPCPGVVPTFVGATNWRTGEYLLIPHTTHEWRQAVYGSMTMGPPIWRPIRWNPAGTEILLVDGGYNTQIPIDGVRDRFVAGQLPTYDLILNCWCGLLSFPQASGDEDIVKSTLVSIERILHRVALDDLGSGKPAPREENVFVTEYLGETLESSVALQQFRFDHGYARAKDVLGGI
jgi:predicted acylesterase/phospholipase RssA